MGVRETGALGIFFFCFFFNALLALPLPVFKGFKARCIN